MSEQEAALEDFLATTGALYDATRVRLLKFLDRHGPLCVCDLQESFGMIQSRLSRHLKILKEAGFLKVQREGRWAYYAIRSPLDRFRASAIEEIRTLPIELPELKRLSESCPIQ
ncbi:metalloregulator ArsR/SmtB family transcription factor [Nitratifractor sp.]|uniref:ArsR/SmtB family transcription factor n=1 Tax=Nitratifractor sp. TaxID=2268144 RepID=UPI0025E6677D|nr:metalloregulator ArsR/SmtB family transcription factor [Nitratifractor sp.]